MTAAVIVVAQAKGGAGKTTLAAHLGVAWAAAGHDVGLIDTDPQASLARWHQSREARLGVGRTGLGFAAAIGWHAVGAIRRHAGSCDILLVDSPAGNENEVRMVMRCAGLVLVPVQPSPVDVWATLPTLEMAEREGVPALLVLNRVPPRASLTAAMREQLALYEAGLAVTSIGNRVAFAAAFAEGWGITECALGSSAAAEIVALAGELLELLPLPKRVLSQPAAGAQPLPSERPVFAVERFTLDDLGTRDSDIGGMAKTTDDLSMLDPLEPAPHVSGENPAETWTPGADQLRAGIASLKRRLARRPK